MMLLLLYKSFYENYKIYIKIIIIKTMIIIIIIILSIIIIREIFLKL